MLKSLKIYLMLIIVFMISGGIFAENASHVVPDKYALVIGNAAYTGLAPLANPVNDADDIAIVLEALGFNVEKIINGNLEQMEDAVLRLSEKLGASDNAYGFFFYAGHGVQSGGENYLIPVNANIPGENFLRNRAMSVQQVLDDLNDARNALNVVVLDACRDNPFGWSRSGTRGLAMVTSQPADSIIVYATSAGARASDGEGRNGLFTSQLLNNLLTPDLDVNEVFRRTGADVSEVSNRQQIPAIYNQFFGIAYLGTATEEQLARITRASPIQFPGRSGAQFSREAESRFWSIGASVGTAFSEPWMVGTIKGTIAPFKYSFLEVGLNVGFVFPKEGIDSYYSLHPYAHYCFFWPFNEKAAGYAGAGIGFARHEYKKSVQISNEPVLITAVPAEVSIGALFFSFLDISYTLSFNISASTNNDRDGTDLMNYQKNKLNHRFSIGYVYRFY